MSTDDPRRFNFTQARLSSLPVPESGRVTYHDGKTPGLCIRVSSTGHKAVYLSKKVNGRHVKLKLGTWGRDLRTVAELRGIAGKALADVEGTAKRRRRARSEATVADLWHVWEEHIENHKRPKSQSEDRRQYRTHLEEKWAKRPVSEITLTDVAKLHGHVGRKHGKYAANRLLALLSAMFSEGRRAGLVVAENPCSGVRRFKEESRDRWLDGDELRAFFAALEQEPDRDLRDFFLICLLTGARKGNVKRMRWQDVDLRRGLWRIPETKGGEVVVVPLVGPAVELLLNRKPASNGSGWVFPGRSRDGHINPSNRAWQRICQRGGLENVHVHDLRRTLGSWMTVGGTSLPIVAKALGHRSLQATQVYARLDSNPVRRAIELAANAMLTAGGLLPAPEKKTEN